MNIQGKKELIAMSTFEPFFFYQHKRLVGAACFSFYVWENIAPANKNRMTLQQFTSSQKFISRGRPQRHLPLEMATISSPSPPGNGGNFQERLVSPPAPGKSARTINPTNVVQYSNQLLPSRDTHGGRTVMVEGGPAKIFMKIKHGGLLISLELIAIGCKHDAT